MRRAAVALLFLLPATGWAQAAGTQPMEADPVDLAPVDLGKAQPTPEPPKTEADWMTAPAKRRGGFSVGLIGGGAIGDATGFPNDALKIDRDEFRTETGASFGGAGTLWIGGALADWLVFGVGGHGGALVNGDYQTTFGAFAFHVDVFPAYAAGGVWEDIGLMLEPGIGLTDTRRQDDDSLVVESGGASRLSLGVFYDGFRLSKISTGPIAAFDMIWSPSTFRPMAWIGWRTALYTSP